MTSRPLSSQAVRPRRFGNALQIPSFEITAFARYNPNLKKIENWAAPGLAIFPHPLLYPLKRILST
jgi:hypothetical protein